jgi:hypothetical protein
MFIWSVVSTILNDYFIGKVAPILLIRMLTTDNPVLIVEDFIPPSKVSSADDDVGRLEIIFNARGQQTKNAKTDRCLGANVAERRKTTMKSTISATLRVVTYRNPVRMTQFSRSKCSLPKSILLVMSV